MKICIIYTYVPMEVRRIGKESPWEAVRDQGSSRGHVGLSQKFQSCETNSWAIQGKRGRLKKAVQQGRRAFGARSVHGVREHAKSPRTQLAAFFNIPRKGSEDLAGSSTSAVDLSKFGKGSKKN